MARKSKQTTSVSESVPTSNTKPCKPYEYTATHQAQYQAAEELRPLPCPFCGSIEVAEMNVYVQSIGLTFHKCECSECKACTGLKKFASSAVVCWNRRA